jgi:hypothetical protein
VQDFHIACSNAHTFELIRQTFIQRHGYLRTETLDLFGQEFYISTRC